MLVSILRKLNKNNYTTIVYSKNKPIYNCNKLFFSQNCAYSQQIGDKNEFVKLHIQGEDIVYPSIWLRDNCQCKQCFHKSAQSRTIDWSNIDINIRAKEIEETQETVKVVWDDGHTSNYDHEWLKIRRFTLKHQRQYEKTFYKPSKIIWNNDTFKNIFKKHDYDTLLHSDKALHDWILNLAMYGVALITNTPDSETAVDKIVQKIGFPKKTHYGEKFTVQHVVNTSNVAYLSSNLQMHTDLPYYEYVPGVNILHCLVQTLSEGGENLLSDSHYVANYMQQKHFTEYKLLTDVEVEWSDIGTEHGNQFYKLHRTPVLCTDKNGEVVRVNFSIPQRGNYFPCDIELVKPWYKAQQLFYQLSYRFAARFKTQNGEILAFDNTRLLHGRNSYVDTNKNVRKIIGVYLDWDEIYSKFRCLKMKFKS